MGTSCFGRRGAGAGSDVCGLEIGEGATLLAGELLRVPDRPAIGVRFCCGTGSFGRRPVWNKAAGGSSEGGCSLGKTGSPSGAGSRCTMKQVCETGPEIAISKMI